MAVSTDGKMLRMNLYGVDGDDSYSMERTSSGITGNIKKGLAKGNYYVNVERVYSDQEVNYRLENKFTPTIYPTDKETSNYINSPSIDIGKSVYGHIGYIDERW